MTQELLESPTIEPTIERRVLVTARSGRKPNNVALLSQWCYVEASLMRLIAAWGRYFPEWTDKVACHRHVWEQSECVETLRRRLQEFPGTVSNLDAPVSQSLETLVNTILQAPTHEDAIDGIYGLLMSALTTAYLDYGGSAHAVHDAPTLSSLHSVLAFKNGMRLWLRDYRRRVPHTTDATYKAAVERELTACGALKIALPVGEAASPCGVNTDYRLPARTGKRAEWTPKLDFASFIDADFSTSIETRRLFWCYGYMLEMTLAEGMLRWVWAAHFMPWGYQKELARHLWDESRHGDSGLSRFLDFGIGLDEVGYPHFGSDARGPHNEAGQIDYVANMTPQELFEQAFFIGMIAETGHFQVKNEAYEDFKNGGDLESAEMMLFDVIDEGAHVRYCHEWLPELAKRANLELGDYRARAAATRADYQTQSDARLVAARDASRDESDASYAKYQELLGRMRAVLPLSNAQTCPPRSHKPM